MISAKEFVDDFLAHRSDYDPVKAREYYLRTRELKGRKPAMNDANSISREKQQAQTLRKPVMAERQKRIAAMDVRIRRLEAAAEKMFAEKDRLTALPKTDPTRAAGLIKVKEIENKLRQQQKKLLDEIKNSDLNEGDFNFYDRRN